MSRLEKHSSAKFGWEKSIYYSNGVRIPYLIYGQPNKFFFITAIHGDEAGSAGPFAKVLTRHREQIKGFCFIPQGSPSAVRLKTEENEFSHNVNRMFLKNIINDPEAKAVAEIVQALGPFDIIISGHEDELNSFYIYHEGKKNPNFDLDGLRSGIKEIGVDLHTGYDHQNDPILNNWVTDGYCTCKTDTYDGTFETWAIMMGLANTVYTAEIPMYASAATKELIYQVIFRNIILNNPQHIK